MQRGFVSDLGGRGRKRTVPLVKALAIYRRKIKLVGLEA
jgi:hypothetical protein